MPLLKTSASDYTAYVKSGAQTLSRPSVVARPSVANPVVGISAIVRAAAVSMDADPTTTVLTSPVVRSPPFKGRLYIT
jgi:hypothetical protein